MSLLLRWLRAVPLRLGALRLYLRSFTGFSRPVKRFLLGMFVLGLSGSVNWLVLNFYLKALGLDDGFIGLVNSLPAVALLMVGYPVGRWGDRMPRHVAIRAGAVLLVASGFGLALAPTPWLIAVCVAIAGVGGLLLQANAPPYMAENSQEGDRTHLFSAQAALSTGTGFLGSLLGGWMPSLLAGLGGGKPEDVGPLRGTLFVGALIGALSLIAFLGVKQGAQARSAGAGEGGLDPVTRALFLKLLLPHAAIALGAGMIMPFLNLYVHGKWGVGYDVIGVIFGVSSLLTAGFMLIQPWMAERVGKVRAVVFGQAASVPFLLLLGYSPWLAPAAVALFLRGALMNMAQPLYTAFSMEVVPETRRAYFMSLDVMVWSAAWAAGSNLSGQLRQAVGPEAGFQVLFATMAALYSVGIVLFAMWFHPAWRGGRAKAAG